MTADEAASRPDPLGPASRPAALGLWWAGFLMAGVVATVLMVTSGRDTTAAPAAEADPASSSGSVVDAAGSDPVTVDVAATQAVLDALDGNGLLARLETESRAAGLLADGDPDGQWLLPVVHLVRCSREACSAVVDWGRANGLESSEVIESLEHGGVPWYRVELREHLAPTADTIVDRARSVMVGVEKLGGADYQEWMADTDRSEGGGR